MRLVTPLAFALILPAATLAQAVPDRVFPDAMLLPIDPAAFRPEGVSALHGLKQIVLPTVLLHVAVEGAPRASALTLRGGAQVTGEFRVIGLEKRTVQEAAQMIQSDFVHLAREVGVEILLYDDVRNHSEFPTAPPIPVDSSYGAPVLQETNPPMTYTTVAPSDPQLIAGTPRRRHQAFAALARETGAVVLIPEFWFTAPQAVRVRAGQPGVVAAALELDAGMSLSQVALAFITPTGATGMISLAAPLPPLETEAGTLVFLGADPTRGTAARDQLELRGLDLTDMLGMIHLRARNPVRTSVHQFEFFPNDGRYSVALIKGALSVLKAGLQFAGSDVQ